jgi:hypothetical protein
MTIVNNARRVRLQTTFSAIDVRLPDRDGRTLPNPGRPTIERAAILHGFAPTPDEIRVLDEDDAIAAALASSDPLALPTALAASSGGAEWTTLQKLAAHRKSTIEQCLSTLMTTLCNAEMAWSDAESQAYTHSSKNDARFITQLDEDDGHQSLEKLASEGLSTEARTGAFEGKSPVDVRPLITKRFAQSAAFEHQPLGLRIRAALESSFVPVHHKTAIRSTLQKLGVRIDTKHFEDDWKALSQKQKALDDIASAQPETGSSLVSPIGWLHLERLSHSPTGIEHGELLYSLPLSPGERVAIVHKEWSNTEEEFQRLMSDQFEDYSERGVIDKTDMAEATETQQTHATAFSVAVTGSGGLGPMNVATTTGYSASDVDQASRKASIDHSQTLTKKASARARKEHRTSFRLAKKTQVEDQTIRWIKNPDPMHPVRYDFYQLLRKWRVDLRRYGVRMTYDLTIPQPAVDLLGIYREIWQLDSEIEKGFTFDLAPGSVTRTTWRTLAEQYGATVEPPPPLVVSVQATKVLGPYTKDEPKQHVDELHVTVPEGYVFAYHDLKGRNGAQVDPNGLFTVVNVIKLHDVLTPTAEIIYSAEPHNVFSGLASVRVWFQLGAETEKKWQLSAFNTLRDAANNAYTERRQMLEARREKLLKQLSDMDALTLRKLEREELMKGVLRWLFGQKIDFAPAVNVPFYDTEGNVTSTGVQSTVLQHGRVISFLHQAIEWENINYFLYPYFWTKADSWNERLRLQTNDPIHEAFLRAGAARVVLTIRPGWERAFLAFLSTGSLSTTLPDDHPYMTIVQEIETYAKTNYPGIVPANPDEVDPEKATQTAEGVLVASWFEYTPTSGIDIKIGETAPTEGVFASPAFEPSGPWSKLGPLVDALEGLLVAVTQKIAGS